MGPPNTSCKKSSSSVSRIESLCKHTKIGTSVACLCVFVWTALSSVEHAQSNSVFLVRDFAAASYESVDPGEVTSGN